MLSAVRSASSEMSHASTYASPRRSFRLMAMQPLPVPMSRMRFGAEGAALETPFISLSPSSTSHSVSGRGISTEAFTPKWLPQKSA